MHSNSYLYQLMYRKQCMHRKSDYIYSRTRHRCQHCDNLYPTEVLEFHHEDRKEKEQNLAWTEWTPKKVEKTKKEADKCIILCANCHRLEHKRIEHEKELVYFRYRSERSEPNEDMGSGDDGSEQRGDENVLQLSIPCELPE